MRGDLFGLWCFYRKGLVPVRPAIPLLPDGLRAKAAGLASASVPTSWQNVHVASWHLIGQDFVLRRMDTDTSACPPCPGEFDGTAGSLDLYPQYPAVLRSDFNIFINYLIKGINLSNKVYGFFIF